VSHERCHLFYNNFGSCRQILIILSLVHELRKKMGFEARLCCRFYSSFSRIFISRQSSHSRTQRSIPKISGESRLPFMARFRVSKFDSGSFYRTTLCMIVLYVTADLCACQPFCVSLFVCPSLTLAQIELSRKRPLVTDQLYIVL